MELQNKVIGIVGTSNSVKQYIITHFPNTYMDFFVLDTNEDLEKKISVLDCMRIWSEQYASHKFDDDDLAAFLHIGELDSRIDNQIAELTTGERKRLLFLKAMLVNRYRHIIQELFDSVSEEDFKILTQMIIELSTYATIILTSENDKGFSICDEVIRLEK